jgi:hypothetical protein
MSSIQNTNRNNISIKSDSAVQLVRELSKLGVFRKKDKKRAKPSASTYDGGEMVGYTRPLDGPQMRNLPPIQQITPGLTQNQIEGIQRSNDAVVSALRSEIDLLRSEKEPLNNIVNPAVERFRGSIFPAQASGDQPIDPFASSRMGSSVFGNLPDVQEERFNETLNEGGPEAIEQQQTSFYAPAESKEEPAFNLLDEAEEAARTVSSRLLPYERIRASSRAKKDKNKSP